MRSRLRDGVSDLADRWPWLVTAGRAVPTVVGVCVLLAAIGVLVGYGLGGPAPTGSPPAVDFGDDPADVVADASERLTHRNHTLESWTRTVDYRRGSVGGGLFYRLHVEPSRGHVRGRVQPAGAYGNYGFLGDVSPEEIYAAQGTAWVRPAGDGDWLRSPPAAALAADARETSNLSRERLVAADLTVIADNETRYVAGTTDARAAGFDDAGSVRYVVAKGEDPHLREIRHVRDAPTGQSTRLVRVVNYGETVAIRPLGLPPTTVSELAARTTRGWGRLAP